MTLRIFNINNTHKNLTLDKKILNHYNIIMNKINFSWDKNKAQTNLKKHKISFEEAQTVFDDENARLIFDPDHSEDEDRFILLGYSCTSKILTVVHCYRDDEENVRIISARKSTKHEENQYREITL